MRDAREGEPGPAGLSTMNLEIWRKNRRERARWCASRCIQIARLITRLCCTWHTMARGLCCMRYGVRPRRAKCGMTNGRGTISRHANRFLCGENFARDCARDVRELRYTCADDLARARARYRQPAAAENRLHYISVQECCSAMLFLSPAKLDISARHARMRRHWMPRGSESRTIWAFRYSISEVAMWRHDDFDVT